MIIYKIQESGQATDFQFAQSCPVGWKSIPGDRIPEDITPYHEKRYIDAQSLESQKSECIRLLNLSEIHCTSDPPYPDDVAEWVAYRKVLREILQSDELWDMPKKPF